MNTMPIPVSAGEEICKRFGYDQVVIIARRVGSGGVEHVTTYGVNPEHCVVAAMIGDFIKYQVMKWEPTDETMYHTESKA